MNNLATDTHLMAAIADGDQESLRTLYELHGGLVLALCLRILHDREAAEEITVEVFCEIWRHADRYDSTRSSPLGYLILLARSRAIDRMRAECRVPAVGRVEGECRHPTTEPAADQQSLNGEKQRFAHNALASLSAIQRQVLELAFYEGASQEEIAERLGLPSATVKTHIRKGLTKLRSKLKAS